MTRATEKKKFDCLYLCLPFPNANRESIQSPMASKSKKPTVPVELVDDEEDGTGSEAQAPEKKERDCPMAVIVRWARKAAVLRMSRACIPMFLKYYRARHGKYAKKLGHIVIDSGHKTVLQRDVQFMLNESGQVYWDGVLHAPRKKKERYAAMARKRAENKLKHAAEEAKAAAAAPAAVETETETKASAKPKGKAQPKAKAKAKAKADSDGDAAMESEESSEAPTQPPASAPATPATKPKVPLKRGEQTANTLAPPVAVGSAGAAGAEHARSRSPSRSRDPEPPKSSGGGLLSSLRDAVVGAVTGSSISSSSGDTAAALSPDAPV